MAQVVEVPKVDRVHKYTDPTEVANVKAAVEANPNSFVKPEGLPLLDTPVKARYAAKEMKEALKRAGVTVRARIYKTDEDVHEFALKLVEDAKEEKQKAEKKPDEAPTAKDKADAKPLTAKQNASAAKALGDNK